MPTLYNERILIVEDESLIRWSLRARLVKEGYEVREAPDLKTGLELVESFQPHLILLDIRLPDGDGLTILRETAQRCPEVVVILMTAYSTVESAVEAMRLGAYTYMKKPFDLEEMILHVQKGLETTALRREVDRLRLGHGDAPGQPYLVAESPAMQDILETVKKVNAVGSTTILLRGENGTGKDVLARAIHYTSPRASRPFQNITCTALPDALLESELFGHERGAFTDARQRKQGLFEIADGGTVFLDEIGDMSLALQAKLLRFLEDRAFRRVGGIEDLRVNVRIIAATNRDLEKTVTDGTFRQDLYYRLSVIPIVVPPLRDRRADILPLARLFVSRYAQEFKRKVSGFTPEAEACLAQHDWPGNVRELRNVVERAMILGSSELIGLKDLPPELRRYVGGTASLPTPIVPAPVINAVAAPNVVEPVNVGVPAAMSLPPGRLVAIPDEGLVFEDLERDLVEQALARTSGNQTQAAKLLGMTRDQIRYRIEKFHLS